MKDELSKQIISTVRQFVKKDVAPTVHELEDKDKKEFYNYVDRNWKADKETD